MLSVLLWQLLTWDLFYSVCGFAGNGRSGEDQYHKFRSQETFWDFLSESEARPDYDDVRDKRKFCSSQCFIPVPISEVRNKKKHHHSFVLLGGIPLVLGSSICSWFRFTLALCWPAILCLLSFSDWQVFNHLGNGRPLWVREVWAWHPRHGDESLLRVWHYKSFTEWEEKMLYSAEATEQHCICSRGHGSLVASGKRSTRCHKVTER